MVSHSFSSLFLLLLTSFTSAQQCDTADNPYCRGNDKFNQICCNWPNVCYWADRQGTPACCPAGQVCHNYQGVIVTAQPIVTTTIQPAPVQPTTVYTTIVPPPETQTTYVQPTCCHETTITESPPTTFDCASASYPGESGCAAAPTQTAPPTITTTEGGAVGSSIGSTVVAAGSSVVPVFQGAAATARPKQCAVPLAGAMAVAAAWQLG